MIFPIIFSPNYALLFCVNICSNNFYEKYRIYKNEPDFTTYLMLIIFTLFHILYALKPHKFSFYAHIWYKFGTELCRFNACYTHAVPNFHVLSGFWY